MPKQPHMSDNGDYFMPKCGAVIVTYHPDAATIDHLKKVTELCDKVVIVDNTPGDKATNFPAIRNLVVFKFHNNAGLAAALNKGIELAGEQGIQNIFLFDQDSLVPSHFFHSMLSFKSNIDKVINNCALYVPNSYDRNSKTVARFPLLTPFTVKHATCENIQLLQRNRAAIAITSGNLITYSRFREIGPMRDDYFIDFIDNEYCLRLHNLGFKIAINCDVLLDHAVGTRSTHRFLGITIKPNNHLPVRRYYISRNGVRTAIDYASGYPSYIILIVARMIHELISIVLYEGNKLKKIEALIWGTYHGLVGKMGKCQIKSLT
jgi:rhamnosyltransferase